MAYLIYCLEPEMIQVVNIRVKAGKITRKFLSEVIFLPVLARNTIRNFKPFLSCAESIPSKDRRIAVFQTDTHEDTFTRLFINGALLH